MRAKETVVHDKCSNMEDAKEPEGKKRLEKVWWWEK
jgi:hypothetical protein